MIDAHVSGVFGVNTRVYATDDPRPETGRALVVIGQAWDSPGPPAPDGAVEIAVGDDTGWLFDHEGQKRLLVYADEYLYQFKAFNSSAGASRSLGHRRRRCPASRSPTTPERGRRCCCSTILISPASLRRSAHRPVPTRSRRRAWSPHPRRR